MNRYKKLLITCSIFLLLYSMASLGAYLFDDYRLKAQINELKQLVETWTPAPLTDMQSNSVDSKSVILPEFKDLILQNRNIVGWLKIDGTQVDYPVMQNKDDPEYYLNHDFHGKENKNGLPFLDTRFDIYEPDILLIHGHNMRSGLIFGELMQYKKENYYKEHPIIEFNTLYEKGSYEIMSVILSKVYRKEDDVFKYYQFTGANTQTEFDSYVQNIKRLALYDTGINAQFGDQLIILSTCESSTENGRLAVVARKQ